MKEEKELNLFRQTIPKQPASIQYWKEMVQIIIDHNCTDPNKIEMNFDALIPYLSNNVISQLYIQLLEYYKNLDSEGAAYYWEIFDNDFKNESSYISENTSMDGDFDDNDFFYD